MATPLYTKLTIGLVEQVYDDEGNCLSQKFVPMDSEAVDRRYIAQEGDDEDGLEDDEVIEHPDDLKELTRIEKHMPFDMIQPIIDE